VTVSAVDAFVADVMPVPELYGLFAREVRLRVVGRTGELRHKPKRYAYEENRAEYAQPRKDVCAAMKYLAHYFLGPGFESLIMRAACGRRLRRGLLVRFLSRGLQGECTQSCDACLPGSGMIWICPTGLNTVA
jgi:hypothetical protein